MVGAANRILDSLSVQLGDGPFFFGDEPTTYDATVYAFTAGALCKAFDNEVRKHAATKENLVAYEARLKERYWKMEGRALRPAADARRHGSVSVRKVGRPPRSGAPPNVRPPRRSIDAGLWSITAPAFGKYTVVLSTAIPPGLLALAYCCGVSAHPVVAH